MRKKLINSQLSNYSCNLMYLRQLMTLAENVFIYENLPENIDLSYLNKHLTNDGSICFFYDEILDEILALPYQVRGRLDVYGRPVNITAIGQNGYRKKLNKGDYVIMYDNTGRYPLYLDIVQYAERLSMYERTIDVNITMQRTPRFWKCKRGQEKTLKDLINNVDGMEESIITYDNIDLDDIECTLNPAPFVADKINIEKEKLYNEFLRLVGIANMSYTKKERNISDEITAMQGGTIASRFSRFEPRKRAIEQINEKFNLDIKVKYYDGMPTTAKELVEYLDERVDDNFTTESGGDENDAIL